jgi:hypothetical protein
LHPVDNKKMIFDKNNIKVYEENERYIISRVFLVLRSR